MGATSAVPSAGPAGGARRPLVAIAGVVALLVLAAIASVLFLGARPTTYAPDLPEGAYQRYLAAFDANDYETAYTYFSARVRSGMTLSAFIDESAARSDADQNVRVWIDRAERSGDRATLHLTLERSYSAGLQSSRYRYTDTVRLVLENGSWRIDERLIGTQRSYT